MAKSRKINEKTPCGGIYSEMYFFDDNGNSVDEVDAVRCVIRECDAEGNLLNETWGYINPQKSRKN